MEFLEGMDVKHILKLKGNRVEYDWARRVVLTILYTLKEIHKRGVIHRDIAPDNIIVTNEGVIKLIDFGAAKYAERVENEIRRSCSKRVMHLSSSMEEKRCRDHIRICMR